MAHLDYFGMYVASDEKTQTEKDIDVIRELKKELDGTEIIGTGIALNNKFFSDMFLQLFEKYPPTIHQLAEFMKQVKEESLRKNVSR